MLREHYPDRLLSSPEFIEFQNAMEPQALALKQALDAWAAQLNVQTATYGLAGWEKALGIATDVTKSDASRRESVMAKLRGSGTATVNLIKSIAASFVPGEIDLTEMPSDSKFEVHCAGQLGVPENYDALKAAVEEVKPAHLIAVFTFEYYKIGNIHGKMKLGELQTKKLNMFKGGN